MAQVIELLALLTVMCFCVVQKQKGVADAMIEADTATLDRLLSESRASYLVPQEEDQT
jgi:hypothetical protein